MDVWALSEVTISEGSVGLRRACRWMRVLSFSGAEVPWPILTRLIERQTSNTSSREASLDLVIAVNTNGAPIDSERFAALCCQMFLNVTVGIGVHPFEDQLSSEEQVSLLSETLTLEALRCFAKACYLSSRRTARHWTTSLQPLCRQKKSWLTSLLGEIVQTLVGSDEYGSLSKRRRVTGTQNLLALDERMVLAAASLLDKPIYPTKMVLDFFWLLFSKAALVGNVNGFVSASAFVRRSHKV